MTFGENKGGTKRSRFSYLCALAVLLYIELFSYLGLNSGFSVNRVHREAPQGQTTAVLCAATPIYFLQRYRKLGVVRSRAVAELSPGIAPSSIPVSEGMLVRGRWSSGVDSRQRSNESALFPHHPPSVSIIG